MGILRFVVWTGCCVALGIALATVEVGGKTIVQHAERSWKQQSPKLEKVKDGAGELVDDVKKKVATHDPSGPTEQHSREDRQAVDQIIAKRQK